MATLSDIDLTTNPGRLLPYAKDHDRLQLALLYIEAESKRHEDVGIEFRKLETRKIIIQQRLEKLSGTREVAIKQYLHKWHPAKYMGSPSYNVIPVPDDQTYENNERSKEWCDQELERIFSIEQSEMKVLTDTLKRMEILEAERSRLGDHIIQRESILKLIEELHATAFDGDTPEFPHEDQLEALVKVAETALQGEQAVLDKLHEEDGLVELAKIAESARAALVEISMLTEEIYERFCRERPIISLIFVINQFWKHKISERCKSAAQQCQALKEGVDLHFSEHPNTILSPRAQSMVPQVDAEELMGLLSRAAFQTTDLLRLLPKERLIGLVKTAMAARGEIRATAHAADLMKMGAKKSVEKAKTMLDLRRRQLTAARSQILDHIADPEKCPLEQRAEQLPDYPEQIAIHGLPTSDPSVSRLLAASETYSVTAYVNDIVQSRLSRARRTTHPPIFDLGRYQPPMYDELDDPELFARRYQRDVPPVEGETPGYSEEPDFRGVIRTEPREVRRFVHGELDELVAKTRRQLGLKSQVQLDDFNEMVRIVTGILGASGLPLIMSAPVVRS